MGVLSTYYKGFTFDGINSRAYGVYVADVNVFNAPERDVEMISVPGRNGDLTIDHGRFENIEVEYDCFVAGDDESDFNSAIANFRNALASRIGYKRLVNDFYPDEYRMASFIGGVSVSQIGRRAGNFKIGFNCMPQRWLTSGEMQQSWTTTTKTLTNPTQFDAKPLIEVTGHGVLTIGSQSITINGTSSTQVIHIDCDTMEAWEMSGSAMVPRNDYIQNAGDDFPVLVPGANSIRRGTGISRVAMTPRWWRV